jgi:serpin B
MDRRTFMALLSLPAVAQVLAACGGDDADTSPGPTGALVKSDVARASGGDPLPAVGALATFGGNLYAQVSGQPGNLVVSPASIAIALAMARVGARATTLEEMTSTLGITEPADHDTAMNGLTTELESRSGTFPDGEGNDQEVLLAIANSLWGQDGLSFESAFLDTLAEQYGAGMWVVDYASDAESARQQINAWVSEETEGRIPELLAAGTVTPDWRLSLVNAVYLKAPWEVPFSEQSTVDSAFTTDTGTSVTVPFMHRRASMPHSDGDGWHAVELSYIGGDLAMLLVLPDEGRLADVEAQVPTGLLDEAAGALVPVEVILDVPRWDTESKLQLADVLGAMGMPTAFTESADFSGMTTEEQLAIAAVVHQANITVDEKGTEAAAATAIGMAATAAPADEPLALRLDRPFLFALRDRPTGAVLFLGRVGDPSATRAG